MQWPPLRPRPNSDPSIVITSIPALRNLVFVYSFPEYARTTPGSTARRLFPSSHCSR